MYIVDHCIVAIGNLAADNARFRDLVLKHSGIESLLKVCNAPKRRSTYLNAIWAITNLCRGSPLPTHVLVDTALSFLAKQVKSNYFENVLTETNRTEAQKVFIDILSTFSALTDGSKTRIDRLL